jgi:thiol-disulfide isomerase/thioredoxin/uncharacterized membrane protein YphA (DoxX/SURF4 family)
MKILNHILRILVGVVFILSGLAKLFPIEPFEVIFVDLGISNWLVAPFVARFIIAFEITLGLCIVFDVWLKNIIYKITLGSLAVFTLYLIYLLITKGNDVDCGCFGSFLALTPVQSIIKNVILIIILLLVKRRHHSYGLVNWLIIPFLAIAFASTFLLNRVGLQNASAIELNEVIDYSGLPNLYNSNKKVDFTKGKKVVAFLSYSCPHCESAAHKLAYLQTKYDIDNLYVVIGSKQEENIQVFLDKTKIDFPMMWFDDEEFYNYSGPSIPAFVYIENGVLKKKWTGEFFKVEELEEVLSGE